VNPASPAAEEYLVIVHGSGGMEDHSAAAFWSEVPALSACMAEGADIPDVLANTEAAITRWLERVHGQAPPIRITADLAL
jgi:predicted RNase H-like HicB family nuclease